MQELWLCERFHCTPSQLDEEDTYRILRAGEMDAIYRALQKKRDGQKLTPAEIGIDAQVMRELAEAD